mmetsp:Transcript_4428/g.17421  ORF Transcript_4428/g.17421 Transcript_4428/m.17421 type:complete len:218 (-) Transcript_4428:5-658(-)
MPAPAGNCGASRCESTSGASKRPSASPVSSPSPDPRSLLSLSQSEWWSSHSSSSHSSWSSSSSSSAPSSSSTSLPRAPGHGRLQVSRTWSIPRSQACGLLAPTSSWSPGCFAPRPQARWGHTPNRSRFRPTRHELKRSGRNAAMPVSSAVFGRCSIHGSGAGEQTPQMQACGRIPLPHGAETRLERFRRRAHYREDRSSHQSTCPWPPPWVLLRDCD